MTDRFRQDWEHIAYINDKEVYRGTGFTTQNIQQIIKDYGGHNRVEYLGSKIMEKQPKVLYKFKLK